MQMTIEVPDDIDAEAATALQTLIDRCAALQVLIDRIAELEAALAKATECGS